MELRSLTAAGKRLLCSLVVRQQIEQIQQGEQAMDGVGIVF